MSLDAAAVLRDTRPNETGAIMSGYFRQFRHGDGEARRKLDERLARKEIGDAAYDEAASFSDNRAFSKFGVVFILVLGAAILAVTWLDA